MVRIERIHLGRVPPLTFHCPWRDADVPYDLGYCKYTCTISFVKCTLKAHDSN